MKPAEKIAYAYNKIFKSVISFSITNNILMFVLPLYSLQVFDKVVSSGSLNTLAMLSILAFACFIAFGIINLARAQVISAANTWIERYVAPDLLENSIYQSCMGKKVPIGQHLTDLNNIKGFAANHAAGFFFDLPFSIIYIIVIYMIHPVLCIICLCGCIIIFGIALIYDVATKSVVENSSEVFSKERQMSEESVLNAEAVAALGMVPSAISHWQKYHGQYLQAQEKMGYRSSAITSFLKVIRFTLQIIITGGGVYLVLENQMSIGGVIASSILVSRAFAPYEQAMASWKSFVSARKSYATIKETFAEPVVKESVISLPKPKGVIVAKDLSFAYPGMEKPSLYKANFELKQGETMVIIGRNASGKTTLAKLLAGVLPAIKGEVRLDGADIYDAVRSGWGKHIGYLPQRAQLFDKSVAENIARLEEGEIDSAKVVAIAKLLGVHDSILKLPNGYESSVGLVGSYLSTGVTKSIALARAFYGNPSVLVLDEPNSNLDYNGEMSLLNAIKQAKKNKITIIMVSHTQSLLSLSDKALVVDGGVVQLFGPTQEVMKKLSGSAKQEVNH